MANRRITDLPAISSASINDDDLLMVVDVAEVDPGLKNKKLNFSDTKQYFNSYYLQLTGGTIAGSLVVSNNLTVSGSFSPVNITVTGSGVFNDIVVTGSGRFTNYLSGNTITGGSIQGLNINATTGNVTTLIVGTETVGTGTFTRISGITITGTSGLFTTGNFLQVSGTTGLFSSLSGTNVTGVNIVGTTQISGAIVTGNTGRFSDVTGVSGVFTTRLSGATITGDTILFTTATGATGTFTRVSGTTVTGATGLFAQLTGVSGAFIQLSGTTVTGATGLFTNLTGSLGTFTNQISGAIVTGITGQFTNLQGVSGVFTGQVSGSTITGDAILVSTLTGASGTFTRVSGTTVTGITGLFQTVTALTGTFINTISIPSIATTGNITAGGNLFISGNGTFSSGIVVSGQISGNSITGITGTFGDLTSNNLYGLTSVSGNLVTGVTGAFTQVTATTGTFTTRLSGNTITGNSISGTSGVFVSGIFTNVSGTVVTGNTGRFSEITGVSGTFTSNISGQTVTGVTGSFTYLNGVSGVFTDNLSGSVITGDTGRFTTVSGISGVFTGTLSGATVTGGSANFTSITGINATITNTLSGATVTGSNASFTRITGVSGVFTTQLSGQNVVGENATFNYITGTTRVEGGTISGATVTGNVGLFTNLTGVSGVFTSRVSGAYITGVTIEAVTVTAITGNFTTANFTQTTTGNILASGFISGVSGLFTASNVSGIGSGIFGGGVFTTGTVSGTFITGQSGQFQTVSGTTVTGTTGLFTSITGVSGVFTSQLSGAVITGDTGNFNTLNVETAIISTGIVRQNITVTGNIQTSGTLSVGQTATIASGLTVSGGTISGVTFTGASGQFTVLTGNTAGFTTVTGTTVTGTTANFVTGTFTTILSGATITGNTGSFTTITGATGVFTSFSGTTVNVATGVFASGTAASPSITFSGDLNTGIYSPGADQVAISTGGSGRLFVNSLGNVGVGSSPTSIGSNILTIHAKGVNGAGIAFGSTSLDQSLVLFTNGDGAAGYLGTYANMPLALTTNSAERLRITSAGLVGVGTSSPRFALSIGSTTSTGTATPDTFDLGGTYSSTLGANPKLRLYWDGTTVYGLGVSSTGSPQLDYIAPSTASHVWYIAGTERMRINSSGAVGIGANPSTVLDVNTSSGNSQLRISNGTYVGYFGIDSTYAGIDYASQSGGHRFRVGGSFTEAMRIDSSSRLLVGTSSARGVASSTNSLVQVETSSYLALSVVNNTNDVGGSAIALAKSRGTSAGGSTIVQAGDDLGTIFFAGADGVNTQSQAAFIKCTVEGTPAAGKIGSRLTFSTTADGASSPTERMRIDNAGRLFVGTAGLPATSSSTSLVHINGSTQSSLRLWGTNQSALILQRPGDIWSANDYNDILWQGTAGGGTDKAFGRIRVQVTSASGVGSPTFMSFYTNGDSASDTERMRIDSSGRVGIGTSSPGVRCEIKGSNVVEPNSISNFLTYGAFRVQTSSSADTKSFAIAGGPSGLVSLQNVNDSSTAGPLAINPFGGNVGIGTTTPGSYWASGDNLVIADSGDCGLTLAGGTTNPCTIAFADGTTGDQAYRGYIQYSHNSDILAFGVTGTEAFRVDSSKRLLVGTSSARGGFDNNSGVSSNLQVEGAGTAAGGTRTALSIVNNGSADADSAGLYLARSGGTSVGSFTAVTADDILGRITFSGADGSEFVQGASIEAVIDATPGANDMPGRLVFSTTADGASSPTERLRIANNGAWGLAGANYGTSGQVLTSNGSGSAPTWQSAGGSSISVADTSAAVLDSGTDGRFVVTCDGNERMRVTTGGQLRLATAGITFNGDTATANELDDYEEGTWNVTFNGSITATTATSKGFYVKIGSLVYINYTFEVATQAGSANMLFQSLPFTSASSTANNNKATTLFLTFENVPTGTRGLAGYIAPGTTTVTLYKVNDNGAFTNLTVADMANAGDKLYLSGWYSV